MNKTSSENNNQKEEKVVAKKGPVIDGPTTYYETKKKNSDRYFMIGTLVISAVFILFLPNIYTFFSKFSISNLFANDKPPVSEEDGGVVANPDEGKTEENKQETYPAVVCTKSTSNDVVTAHTLYFSNSKLKKISLSETYTLGQNYNSTELNKYYDDKKSKYNKYDKIEIETTVDNNIYNATALIDLYEAPSIINEMLTINVEYDNKKNDVLDAYELDGFDCE